MSSALVLAGGGAKGAYQTGVIKALKENGILDDIKYLSGTSIGAINSMLYAMDDGRDTSTMYAAWNDMNLQTVFSIDPMMISEQNYHFSREETLQLIDKYIDFKKLSSSNYRIFNTICNVSEYPVKTEYRLLSDYDSETIKKILLASSALPIIYEPVEINGKLYQDGGICDNVPIRPVYDSGARDIIVICVNKDQSINTDEYPDANIIVISPSYEMGDLVSGTMNFTKEAIKFKQILGYKDGLRAVKTKFEKNDMYIRLEPVLAQNDFNEIMMNIKTETKLNSFEISINANLDKFNAIADKYSKF